MITMLLDVPRHLRKFLEISDLAHRCHRCSARIVDEYSTLFRAVQNGHSDVQVKTAKKARFNSVIYNEANIINVGIVFFRNFFLEKIIFIQSSHHPKVVSYFGEYIDSR